MINVSLVLYNNDIKYILNVIKNVIASSFVNKFYLIDNSNDTKFSLLAKYDKRIEYIFNNANLGYGKAHNIAIRKSIEQNIEYHLVLNPDIYFVPNIIEKLIKFMNKNRDVGLIMPKVIYPDGQMQYLCKLLPTPFDLLGRRFFSNTPLKKYIDKRNNIYELRFSGYNKIMNIPYLSGCFMFFRTEALKDVGLFDERFFMYPEDIDITRRIHRKYKTIYYPEVSIIHDHAAESYKNLKMLKIHMINICKYFNKWGWFFDKERKQINNEVLKTLNYKGNIQ